MATSATPKDRAAARNQIAQQWASRRQERPSTRQSDARPSTAASDERLVPSLCFVIGKAWQEAVSNLTNTWNPSPPPKLKSNAATTSTSTSASKFKGNSFPSVLQILQASALHEQVSQFHGNTMTDETEGEEEAALRVLPSGYDWNQAIWKMAESRSRAFLLLDLNSIVPVLVEWKRQRPSPKVKFLYTVQYNADPKLLQLLLRSQVGLICTNKWDLTKCRLAIRQLDMETRGASALIYDNASQVGKPDGYLRQLVLDGKDSNEDGSVKSVVVDGPLEVTRIVTALQRMRKRRNGQRELSDTDTNNEHLELYFVLRLPIVNGKDGRLNQQCWLDLVHATRLAIEEQSKSTGSQQLALVGISVDVSDGHDQAVFERTLDKVEECYMIQFPVSVSEGPGTRLDMTGVTMPPKEETLLLWKNLSERPNLSHISVDVSHALVSPAGALCTRIIGVKEEKIKKEDPSSEHKNHNSNDNDDDNKPRIRMHYYIDDGCYGSLYTAAEHNAISNPLPLGVDHDDDNAKDNDGASSTYFPSTVWGPTCDGLDRVCRDIPLPKLHRDQWLVFPNLGCRIGEGLGTAFNGFDPPDTAYCVLGYWGANARK